jgi:hypothetical protein
MKQKRSVYLVVGKDGRVTILANRAGVRAAVEALGVKQIAGIYRAIPLEYRTETVVKLGAVKQPAAGKKSGA